MSIKEIIKIIFSIFDIRSFKIISRQKIILGIIFIVALSLLLYQSLLSVQLVRAKALEFRLLSQERLIAYQRKVIRDPQLLIDKIEKTKNKLAGLEKRFIPEQRLTKFFDDLKGLASNTDNRLLSLDIMPAINNGTYEKLPFIISLRGYYVDIVSFLNKLEGYPRLIDIKDIKIQPVGVAERSSEIMMSLEAGAFAIKD